MFAVGKPPQGPFWIQALGFLWRAMRSHPVTQQPPQCQLGGNFLWEEAFSSKTLRCLHLISVTQGGSGGKALEGQRVGLRSLYPLPGPQEQLHMYLFACRLEPISCQSSVPQLIKQTYYVFHIESQNQIVAKVAWIMYYCSWWEKISQCWNHNTFLLECKVSHSIFLWGGYKKTVICLYRFISWIYKLFRINYVKLIYYKSYI